MGKKRQRGFTLLELMVSITIVSLLAATALFAWRASVSGWEKANVELERNRTVLAVHELLTEQIASMAPYQAQIERGGQVMFFEGEAETARFVSRYSLRDRAASGLYLVEYHIAEQKDGTRQLLFQEEPLRGGEELAARIAGLDTESGAPRVLFRPFEAGAAALVLLKGLAECRFEYYQAATPNQQGAWTNGWKGSFDELPQAVRLIAMKQSEASDLEPVAITAVVRNYARRQQPR